MVKHLLLIRNSERSCDFSNSNKQAKIAIITNGPHLEREDEINIQVELKECSLGKRMFLLKLYMAVKFGSL